MLAENPGIIKLEINNTGPFRFFICESFVDNKPMDQFATDLTMMEGATYYGGPASFTLATQNDGPMTAKAQILTQVFQGIDPRSRREGYAVAPLRKFLSCGCTNATGSASCDCHRCHCQIPYCQEAIQKTPNERFVRRGTSGGDDVGIQVESYRHRYGPAC